LVEPPLDELLGEQWMVDMLYIMVSGFFHYSDVQRVRG
jgi:hypothetical protein